MKLFRILLFSVLISTQTSAQDYYQKLYDSLKPAYEQFIQAVLSGDTITADKILQNNVKTQPIQKKAFMKRNIPEHIFNINIALLKDTILRSFKIENNASENKYLRDIFYFYSDTFKMQIFFVAETNKDTVFSREYFSTQPMSSDIFLTCFHETWNSKLYYSNDHPLKYTADFVLKLKAIDSNSTQLKVVALNAEVVNGMSIGVHGPQYEYANVQPSSIEEYSILDFIADKLGDRTLLPLKLPDN